MNPIEMRRKANELKLQAKAILSELQSDGAAALDAEAVKAKMEEAKALNEQAVGLLEQAEEMEALEREIGEPGAVEASEGTATPVATNVTQGAASMAGIDDPAAAAGGSPGRLVTPANARDVELEERGGFHDFGEFALCVYLANPSVGALHRIDNRLNNLFNPKVSAGLPNSQQMARSAGQIGRAPMAAASGLSIGVGTEGGWLLPTAFARGIWDGMRNEVDNLLGMTDQYPLDNAKEIELLANGETSRTTGNRYGGIRGYWIEEAEQLPSSKPNWRKMSLKPSQLALLCYVTDVLLNQAGSALTTWLTRAATEELIWMIGDAIFNGDGAGKPKGILQSAGRVTVAKETNQAADTFIQLNIAKMWARMHARSRRNARWFVNQDVDPQLLTMFFAVTNQAGSENVGGFQAALYNPNTDRIMNRDVIRTEWNKTLGDEGDILLADMSAYATAFFSRGIEQAMSMHLRFDYAETAFRFITSIDGQTWNESPLTPANGSNTLSPFVTLAARA